MHIPDNYLSPSTCAVMGAAMVPVWIMAVRKVKEEVPKEKIPLLGIGAAFSFLLMMFNVPIPGGTTAHALGATLLAILLGPWPAAISITIALLIQALLFGDGGILAFGANSFNIAFVAPFIGYFVYKFIKDKVKTKKGEYIGIIAGSYLGINMAALFAAIELGLQPLLFKSAAGMPLYSPYPLSVSVPAMMITHLTLAGAAEIIFTFTIFAFIKKVSPGIIHEGAKKRIKPVFAVIIALICLSPLGLLAAGTAWGEWRIDEIKNVITGGKSLGFIPEGMKNGFNFSALIPGYGIKGLPDIIGYIISAIAGVAILIIIFKIISAFKKSGTEKTQSS
ncbi:MAG: cobalt transporter CbiM [Actinobacteria bacterium]|nr:cobalt transporter CbiM [Actinomycetota bacterium]